MKPICVQTLYVEDIEQSIAFYNQALGYEVEEKFGESIVQLKSDGVALILQKVDKNYTPSVKLAFQSTDIELDIKQLKLSGATLLDDQPKPCPVGVYITFEDINGIGHELLQFSE
ncbi:VOC family protein [Endozoicomonas arenosclerae]|uniref:VOC family protein n=1 Tax=Endozoicomonas arenosclerae TaxID=1633495 RepID=UPI0007813CEE|nr:VOC family protein [Endozoicomonas arenosclerae]